VAMDCGERGRAHPALQAAGSIPVTFAAWGITGPAGYALISSLANHGVAEFVVILHHGNTR